MSLSKHSKLGPSVMNLIGSNHSLQAKYAWDATWLEATRRNVEKSLARLPGSCPDPFTDRTDRVFNSVRLLLLNKIGLFTSDVKAVASAGVCIATDYFFGAWRSGKNWTGLRAWRPKMEIQRGASGWFDCYRGGLLMSLLLDRSTTDMQLLKWPEFDLFIDEGAWDAKLQDVQFHIALAIALRNGVSIKTIEQVEQIASSRAMHAKLMLAAWVAIENKLSVDAAKAIQQLVAQHRKRFPIGKQIHAAVDIDGSILLLLARQRGLAISLPSVTEDFLLMPESIGMAGK